MIWGTSSGSFDQKGIEIMATITETTDAPDIGLSSPYSITPFQNIIPDTPDGDQFFGRIDAAGDRDIIEIELIGGARYSFRLTAIGSDGLQRERVNVVDENGSSIGGFGLGGIGFATATIGGTYYVTVSDFDGTGVGDYRLEAYLIELPPEPEPTGPTDGEDVLVGTEGNDVIDLLKGNDTYDALGGDDEVYGNGGQDKIDGGAGDDALFGGSGDDFLFGRDGNDYIDGGKGEDLLRGNDGDDVIFGDKGRDVISGANGNDELDGGEDADIIRGGDGDDLMFGGLGNDKLFGNNDADDIFGGGGQDKIYGGSGEDSLFGEAGDDTILGGDDNDFIDGGGGEDLLRGNDGDDVILGNNGRDAISGANGDDFLDGGEGNDTLRGGDDNDTLIGGLGDDLLKAGDGDDILIMDAGNDVLFGEGGSDTFVFNTTPFFPFIEIPLDAETPFPIDGEFPIFEGEFTPWTATVKDFTIFTDNLLIDGLSFIDAAFSGLINPELSGFNETGATLALNSGDTIIFEGITEEQFVAYLDTLDLEILPIDPPIDVI